MPHYTGVVRRKKGMSVNAKHAPREIEAGQGAVRYLGVENHIRTTQVKLETGSLDD